MVPAGTRNSCAASKSAYDPAMAHDGRAVANTILNSADRLQRPLTHMALQKITYFAHGLYIAAHGAPLVKQPFEAWEHGPVVRVVYDAFKSAGDAPIVSRAQRLNPVTRELEAVASDLAPDTASFVEQVVWQYGHIHASELRRMTHEIGGPWHQVWHAPAGRVTLGMRIDNEVVRRHFAATLQRN
jgi:uncharacterized phage-associated protein